MMARAALVIVSWAAVLLAPREGSTGTYGGVDKAYEGFRVYLDASVGSLSDPSLEAGELEDNLARARADLAAIEPALLAAYRRLAADGHPWSGARASLDPRRRPHGVRGAEVRLSLRLPRPEDPSLPLGGGGTVELWVFLHIKDGTSDAAADRVAAAFALAQLAEPAPPRPGALLVGLASAREQLELVVRMLSGGPAPLMHRLVDHARLRGAEVRGLARDGHAIASALSALMDGRPIPLAVVDRVGELPGELRSAALRVLALLAPDAQRSELAASLIRWHRAHPTGDDALDGWLEALAR